MKVNNKYLLLYKTQYGNFRGGDKVIVTAIMEFPATNTVFYTIQNVVDKEHVSTFKLNDDSNLVLLEE